MKEVPKSIFEKIKKLLCLAEGARAINSLHEAELATLKAQELLLEYNLSIENINLRDKEPIIKDSVNNWDKPNDFKVNFAPKNEGKWIISLYFCICRHNFCRGISHKNHDFTILGEKHNTEIVNYICQQLITKLRILAKESYKKYCHEERGYENKGSYIRGFFKGAIDGINDKLYSQKVKIMSENTNINALVLVKNEALKKFEAKEYPKLGIFNPGHNNSYYGKIHGYKTGNNLSINKAIETSALNQKMLG